MGIKLDISVETPLSDDDRDILAGLCVMVLAIANRQNLVDQAEASAQEEEDELAQRICGTVAPDASGSCVRERGHSGRHTYRTLGWQGEHLN